MRTMTAMERAEALFEVAETWFPDGSDDGCAGWFVRLRDESVRARSRAGATTSDVPATVYTKRDGAEATANALRGIVAAAIEAAARDATEAAAAVCEAAAESHARTRDAATQARSTRDALLYDRLATTAQALAAAIRAGGTGGDDGR